MSQVKMAHAKHSKYRRSAKYGVGMNKYVHIASEGSVTIHSWVYERPSRSGWESSIKYRHPIGGTAWLGRISYPRVRHIWENIINIHST